MTKYHKLALEALKLARAAHKKADQLFLAHQEEMRKREKKAA